MYRIGLRSNERHDKRATDSEFIERHSKSKSAWHQFIHERYDESERVVKRVVQGKLMTDFQRTRVAVKTGVVNSLVFKRMIENELGVGNVFDTGLMAVADPGFWIREVKLFSLHRQEFFHQSSF